MRICPSCGVAHELLHPVFLRPDAFVELAPEQREHARADDDLCRIELPSLPPRSFVRAVLPVAVDGIAEGLSWGVWVELDSPSFRRVTKLWRQPEQAGEPPFEGVLANSIPDQPGTLGLPVWLQLTGPETRPSVVFATTTNHPFAAMCDDGVGFAQAAEWFHAHEPSTALPAPDTVTFVCEHVFVGSPILRVVHDDDDDWQFLCGADSHDDGEPRLLGFARVMQRDSGLAAVAQRLPLDHAAERDSAAGPWRIERRGAE
jgi:hypothetical protein